MRIVQINATCEHGSTGLVVKDIGTELERQGEESFYAYQSAKNSIPNGYQIGNVADWKRHALLSRIFGKQAYFSKGATKKLIKWLKEIKPDIVHLHNLHSNYIHLNMVLKYLADADIPTVITLHDCWFFTGKCYHYIDKGCQGFIDGCKGCRDKKGAPISWIFNRAEDVYRDRVKYITAIKSLKVVGCSEWISNEAQKGFLKNCDVRMIRNGVNVDIFKPQDKHELKIKHGYKNKFVVLGIAQKLMSPLNEELMEKLVNSLDSDSVFLVIGCSEQQKQMLSRYGDKIVAKGFVEHRHEMAEYYSMADVFANPSHADTLPTVSMESICCGTPVVTYNNSGCPELILASCGIVVEDRNADEFVKAVNSVRYTEYNCAEIGRANFDKNRLACQYVDLYKQMLN